MIAILPEFKRGKPITTRQLASLLAPFGVAPKVIRRGFGTIRGYEVSQFKDAFARYGGDRSVTATQTAENRQLLRISNRNGEDEWPLHSAWRFTRWAKSDETITHENGWLATESCIRLLFSSLAFGICLGFGICNLRFCVLRDVHLHSDKQLPSA